MVVGPRYSRAPPYCGRLRGRPLKRLFYHGGPVSLKPISGGGRCSSLPQDHSLQVQLEKMEAKLRTLNGGVFEMNEFIKAKESETNYRQLASNISTLVDELNVHVRQTVAY
jgi:hypothetical protein